MIDIVTCPVCNSGSINPFRSCKDFTVSHETFSIKKCEGCTLGITTPRPETDKLGAYYQSQEYISHSGKSSGLMGPIYTSARKFALNWKKNIIQNYNQAGSVLDFGCGTGEFLKTLKSNGWKIEGVEPSDVARTKAGSLTNQKIHDSLNALSDKQFDTITAWHVLEHVPELTQTIEQLKTMLKKDGTIFIAVPNYESPDAEKYKDHWAGYDVPRHLWHFSRKSMKQLIETHQMKIVKILPMKLDAYYVSMLSEKYRTGTNGIGNMFQGFVSGFKSNSAAGTENFSSLIYVAKHI